MVSAPWGAITPPRYLAGCTPLVYLPQKLVSGHSRPALLSSRALQSRQSSCATLISCASTSCAGSLLLAPVDEPGCARVPV